jgi:hypothetical protein
MSKPKKRRPEIMKPGLKQLTPIEKRVVERATLADKLRWEHLFSMNAYKPTHAKG